ncbi:MAG: hypothetical protein OEY97_12865, partial [Nitrospirota bacterium]|nr:hypothetical protein [Nitrospirota bacterium]
TQAVCEANGGIWSVNQKSGSHNIISGSGHSYVAFGGLAIGTQNLIQGPYSSVSGGYYNTATGYGSVSGGNQNTAGYGAVVSGGIGNTANGYNASVNGGWFNTAQGYASSILGGANIGLIYQNQHFP